MIKVSVIMSVFNSLPLLNESIESLQQQDLKNFEVIIVDDGSNDGSKEFLANLQEKDRRFVVLFNEVNIGLTKSLNLALEKAQGKYIARMDDDDIALPSRLKKQSDFLDKNHNVGVVGTYAELFGGLSGFRMHDTQDEILKCKTLFSCQFCHPSTMIRRDVLTKNNITYDESFVTAQDYKLWTDLLTVTDFATLPEVLLKYRIHARQISSVKREQQVENTYRIYGEIFSRLGMEYDMSTLTTHQDLASFSHLSMGVNGLKKTSDHLLSIIKANQSAQVFPQKELERFLGEMFYNLVKVSKVSRSQKVAMFYQNGHQVYFEPRLTKLKLYFS